MGCTSWVYKKLGIPTLEKVAADFLHMKEFFPTPENIIFPFTFIIRFIASAKELLKTLLIFLSSSI